MFVLVGVQREWFEQRKAEHFVAIQENWNWYSQQNWKLVITSIKAGIGSRSRAFVLVWVQQKITLVEEKTGIGSRTQTDHQ